MAKQTSTSAMTEKKFNDLSVLTKTVMAYPNCSFYVTEHLWNSFPLNEITPVNATKPKQIKNPQNGIYQVKGEWGTRGLRSAKVSFKNQITVVLYWMGRFTNIKIFPTGKFHMTGCKDKKEYTYAAIQLLNIIRGLHTPENPTYYQTKSDLTDGIFQSHNLNDVMAFSQVTLDQIKDSGTDSETIIDQLQPQQPQQLPHKSVLNLAVGAREPLEFTQAELDARTIQDDRISVIFDVVMINVDFKLDFKLDQIKLTNVLCDNTKNTEFYPVYEATTNTSVNIKMDYPDPPYKVYDKFYINNILSASEPITKATKVFECKKAKSKKNRTHTFLVFSSSKIIQSGGFYDTEMKDAYNKFMAFVNANRSLIEIRLTTHKFDFSQLKGLRRLAEVRHSLGLPRGAPAPLRRGVDQIGAL